MRAALASKKRPRLYRYSGDSGMRQKRTQNTSGKTAQVNANMRRPIRSLDTYEYRMPTHSMKSRNTPPRPRHTSGATS